MAKISLRAYDREIEGLIEHGQRLDEAVAHCRHILKTFPKHLETYRLLGKAYLEGKRYDQAVDIFQRVLMAAPEDFVSHVGMSIIADDRGKLDEAIWHMERAFEVQPSNAAIQGELQRLFGRRDGVEPTRIRLTRGALARMYVQGELYTQAISEIRAVLGQDPKRADLQILLAQAYFRNGQKTEAAEACAPLLKAYPYCLDANRLMVEILPGTQRAESIAEYRKRVNDLDPYAAHAQESVFHTETVAEGTVSLERLEYTGQAADDGAVLGLGSVPETAAAGRAFGAPIWSPGTDTGRSATSTPGPSGDQLPDFLRNAGWKPTGAEAQDAAATSAPENEFEPVASPGDLPAWVKALAPAEESEAGDEVDASMEAVPDWFRATESSQTAESIAPPAAVDGSGIPDWLQRLGDRERDEPTPAADVQPAGSTQEFGHGPALVPADSEAGPEEPPSWLRDFDRAVESPIQAPASGAPESGSEAPKAEPAVAAPAPEADLRRLGTTPQEQDDAMAWLEGLAERHGAKPEELVTDPQVRKAAAPDWVDKAREAGAQAPDGWAPLGQTPEAPVSADDEYAGLWREQPEPLPQDQPVADAGVEEGAQQPPFDWLSGLSDKDAFAAMEAEAAPEETPIMDASAAPSWLSNLDVQTSQRPEVGAEPAWIADSAVQAPPERIAPEPASEAATSTTDLPEWLAGLDGEPLSAPAPAGEPNAASESLPAWLQAEAEVQPGAAERTQPADWQPATADIKTAPSADAAKPPSASILREPAAPAVPEREAPAPSPASARTAPRPIAGAARSELTSLGGAQSELGRGNIAAALDIYGRLIRKGRSLEDIIRDLRDALYRYPVEVPIWQALGDAYMRANRLQEALDAYTKAEELLR